MHNILRLCEWFLNGTYKTYHQQDFIIPTLTTYVKFYSCFYVNIGFNHCTALEAYLNIVARLINMKISKFSDKFVFLNARRNFLIYCDSHFLQHPHYSVFYQSHVFTRSYLLQNIFPHNTLTFPFCFQLTAVQIVHIWAAEFQRSQALWGGKINLSNIVPERRGLR